MGGLDRAPQSPRRSGRRGEAPAPLERPRLRDCPSLAAVIPAGGSGSRLGRATPKQFLSIGGRPILVATVEHFVRHPAIDPVIVAAPAPLVERTERLLGRYFGAACVARRSRGPRVVVVPGGAERQDSVRLGLEAVPRDRDVVVVHDAVRPFVTRRLLDDVLRAATETGAAICALPIAETVKRVGGGWVEATIDRAGLWAVQTPQAFRTALLREAHEKARRDGVVGTDDAMLVERLGHAVRVVPGIADNVKITTPDDLRRARGLVGAAAARPAREASNPQRMGAAAARPAREASNPQRARR